jgi:hypothetical protein
MYVDKPSMQTLTRLIFNVTLHNDELLNSLDTSWTSQVAEPEIPAVSQNFQSCASDQFHKSVCLHFIWKNWSLNQLLLELIYAVGMIEEK